MDLSAMTTDQWFFTVLIAIAVIAFIWQCFGYDDSDS